MNVFRKPSRELQNTINVDPLINAAYYSWRYNEQPENIVLEKLIIEQSKIINKLKSELINQFECRSAVSKIQKQHLASIKV